MGYRIITVNREFESAGSEIAQAVAARLGLPYYDRFLITAAAGETGIDPERVEAMKKATPEYILANYNWDIVVDQMLRIYRGEKVDYLTVLKEKQERDGV